MNRISKAITSALIATSVLVFATPAFAAKNSEV